METYVTVLHFGDNILRDTD